MVLPIGISLQSRYRVIRSLSKGGMGQIFEIVDEAIPGCPAKVLKVLNGADSSMAATPPPDLVRRFKQEAEILKQLDCSGIPKIFSEDGYFCETVNGHPFPVHCMVMEKIIGEDLETWVKNPQHQLSEDLAIQWLEQLTQTLHYLHSHNIIHRDIKPSNIMLRPSGELVLIDFGISREMTDTYYARKQMDITGTVYGTPQYAPQEQIEGRAVPQSDFFALGRTIAYLLSKIPPPDTLKAQEPSLHWWQVRQSTPTPALTNLLKQMMQLSVARRPKTAIEILQAIARLKRDRDPAQRRRELPWVMLWSLASAGLCIGIRALGWMQPLELAAFDQFMRLRPAEPPDPRIVIITIDEADKEWQFAQGMRDLVPNQSLADAALRQLLLKLGSYQARVIGLDLYRDFPVNQAYPELFELLGSDRLVALCKVTTLENDPSRPPPPEAKLAGFSEFFLDSDGVLRRQPLSITPLLDSACPDAGWSFGTLVAFRYLFEDGIEPKASVSQTQMGDRSFTHLKLPFSGYQRLQNLDGTQILLNYRAAPTPLAGVSRTITLRDFLEKSIPAEWIKDKIVLIGLNIPQSLDNHLTPFGRLPGVVIHAHMISHLLSFVKDNRPLLWVWHPWVEAGWIVILSSFGGLCAWVVRNSAYILLTEIGISLTLGVICFSVFLLNGWIPLVPATAAIILSGASIAALRHFPINILPTHP